MAPCRAWEFRVTCDLAVGETACVVGSVPQLGSWRLDGAVELKPSDPALNGVNSGSNGAGSHAENGANGSGNGATTADNPEQRTVVTLPAGEDVHYRYCVCVILMVEGQRKVVIRRWETDIAPRKLTAAALQDESCCSPLEQFGHITPMRHVDKGWLNVESVVQLQLYNNPVELWKKRRGKYRLKVTPVNLEKKMLPEPLMIGEESSELDVQALRRGKAWPIMELAVMAEGDNFFTQQEQFGREYEQNDFFTFECHMLRPETIRSWYCAGTTWDAVTATLWQRSEAGLC